MLDTATRSGLLHARIQALYRRGYQEAQHNSLLTQTFEELMLALEALQHAETRLVQQTEALQHERDKASTNHQYYHDLFQHAPIAYLVTSLEGTIMHANRAATDLLGATERRLIGRSLAFFTPEGQRRTFREQVQHLQTAPDSRSWQQIICPLDGKPHAVTLYAEIIRSHSSKPQAVLWQCVRPAE